MPLIAGVNRRTPVAAAILAAAAFRLVWNTPKSLDPYGRLVRQTSDFRCGSAQNLALSSALRSQD